MSATRTRPARVSFTYVGPGAFALTGPRGLTVAAHRTQTVGLFAVLTPQARAAGRRPFAWRGSAYQLRRLLTRYARLFC